MSTSPPTYMSGQPLSASNKMKTTSSNKTLTATKSNQRMSPNYSPEKPNENYQKLKDNAIIRYKGEIDQGTKKRHGQGSYLYSNSFFKYEGDWNQGLKHGQGRLMMGDGSIYEGEFANGEISGQGTMTWANGKTYTGEFLNGEKEGHGVLHLPDGEIYEGEWHRNLREGQGKLLKSDGSVMQGEFTRHQPNGHIIIDYPNGDNYTGNVNMNIKEGNGTLTAPSLGYIYSGEWQNNMKHGQGELKSPDGVYVFNGDYENDQPKVYANAVKIVEVKPPVDETIESTQANTKPDKGKKEVPVVPDPSGKIVLNYEIGATPLDFEVHVMYQAPEYEDPVQPSKEEIEEQIKQAQKDAKKNKVVVNPEDFYKKRMISPEPTILDIESGRRFEAILVGEVTAAEPQPKTFKLDFRQDIKALKESIVLQKEEYERKVLELEEKKKQEEKEPAAKPVKGKPVPKGKDKAPPVPNEIEPVDERILLFKPDEEESSKALEIFTEKGIVRVEKLEFPEDFPAGKYTLRVVDVNDPRLGPKVEPIECELNIVPNGQTANPNDKKKGTAAKKK